MYRVVAVIGGALALAACSSTGSDFLSLDALKPAPLEDTVRFESTPPNAEVKAASGQTCRTPCALALPTSGPVAVTFTLQGYQPETETLDLVQETGQPPRLRPNPVEVELTAAPPAAKPKPARRPAAKKPAAKPAAAAQPRPASAAGAAPAQSAPAPAPWPAPTPQR